MNEAPFQLAPFLGHFHPVLVHLPIGGLLLAGILEVLSHFSRFKDAARVNKLILAVTAAGFVGAGVCGWLLAQTNGYDQQLLRWHRWTAFTLTLACLATWILGLGQCQQSHRICLFASLALLLVASHLGGSITHGSDFLTRNAPAWVRSLLGGKTVATAVHVADPDVRQQRVFDDIVQPILAERCSECHGPVKRKGRLRLDTLEGLLRGGVDGPAIVPGNAKESDMIRRLLLPVDSEDHMPPPAKPQPTPAEIALLEWWIDNGAAHQAAQGSPADQGQSTGNRISREEAQGGTDPTQKENTASEAKK